MACINYDYPVDGSLPVLTRERFPDTSIATDYAVYVELLAGPDNTFIVDLFESDFGGCSESMACSQYDNEVEARADYEARVTEVRDNQHRYVERIWCDMPYIVG